MERVDRTIISQYGTSPRIRALIDAMNEWIDPRQDIDNFFDMIWNVETAQGVGLDCWGRIVGVGRVLTVTIEKYFGFDEATVFSAEPFNQGRFYSGQVLTENHILSDDGFRTLIMAKAAYNITDGSIPSCNRILMMLFGYRGNVFVRDNLDMTIDFVFSFEPDPVEASIVLTSGIMPRPLGVTVDYVIEIP